jgi:hypothetical protein
LKIFKKILTEPMTGEMIKTTFKEMGGLYARQLNYNLIINGRCMALIYTLTCSFGKIRQTQTFQISN